MPRTDTPSIFTGWWRFAVRALTELTTPGADIDACDGAIEALARDSVIGGAAHRASVVIRRAWEASRCRAVVSSLVAPLLPESSTATWRAAGWMVAVAGATALVLNRLTPIPIGPLNWVVPAALVAAGLLLMAAAAPLARAAADRQLRHKVS